MYLDYETYKSFGGTLDETTFNKFEYEAETIVNWYTFNRLKDEKEEDYPSELARCMERLIDYVKLQADAMLLGKQTIEVTRVVGEGTDATTVTETIQTSAYIKSQSNDGVSISYNNVDASDLFAKLNALGKQNPLAQLVFRYLQGVRNSKGHKLTYRGLYPDE